MKKIAFILIFAFSLCACVEIQENKMRKDAVQLIEYSKNGMFSVEFMAYSKAVEDKYRGDDIFKFMSILKEEVKNRVDKGESAGAMELLIMFDKSNDKN